MFPGTQMLERPENNYPVTGYQFLILNYEIRWKSASSGPFIQVTGYPVKPYSRIWIRDCSPYYYELFNSFQLSRPESHIEDICKKFYLDLSSIIEIPRPIRTFARTQWTTFVTSNVVYMWLVMWHARNQYCVVACDQ